MNLTTDQKGEDEITMQFDSPSIQDPKKNFSGFKLSGIALQVGMLALLIIKYFSDPSLIIKNVMVYIFISIFIIKMGVLYQTFVTNSKKLIYISIFIWIYECVLTGIVLRDKYPVLTTISIFVFTLALICFYKYVKKTDEDITFKWFFFPVTKKLIY